MPSLSGVVAAAACAILYTALLLALGSLLLLAWMRWPEAVRATVVRQGRSASLVAALAFGLAVVPDTTGTAGLAAALGVPGAVLAWWAFGRRSRWPLYVAGILLVASSVVTGHAATAAPVRFMAPSVGAHMVAAAFWMAALGPLEAATRRLEPAASAELLDAFAARAAGILIILMVSGLVLALVQVRVPLNLATTAYGRLLSLKIAAVSVLMWLAARNNVLHTPALRRGDARAAEPLRAAVRSELVLMFIVSLLAAALSVAVPPRTSDPTALARLDAGGVGFCPD